ncbi:MAG: hypothetical protein SGJ20_00930 [Planctomycetota bacterium]|nr:hypothetical protein [Planctomycetota bacterium]
MGAKLEYVCQDCGYTAEVSGSYDAGFEVTTQTMYCRRCRELCDVLMGYRRRDENGEYRTIPLSNDTRAGGCPDCRGSDLVLWNNGDPCPRCSGTINQEGCVMLWD